MVDIRKDNEYSIKVGGESIALMLNALSELPYKVSQAPIKLIIDQITEQNGHHEPAKTEAKEQN